LTPGGPLITLFKVDILNIMGPSIIAAGVLWAAARTTAGRVGVYSAATAFVALSTPIVRASGVVALLPIWLQWYIRPAGDMTTFTMFPWAGFVFAGAAAGVLTAASLDGGSKRAIHGAIAAAGATLVAAGFSTAARPTIYRASSFWTSSPTWFAIRVGILMIAFAALYAIEVATSGDRETATARGAFLIAGRERVQRVAAWCQVRLARIGRASLFIYWIHVELVYGYASWLWRHRLPLWGTTIGFTAFCAFIYAAVVLRDGFTPRRRRRPRAVTQAATA